MSKYVMTWLGGPRDGDTVTIDEAYACGPIKVIFGSRWNPEERYVTPRLTEDVGWILPFYEGTPEETR